MSGQLEHRHPFLGICNSVTGTTSSGYVAFATIECLGYQEVMIFIGAAVHDLKYSITGYAYPGSFLADDLVEETILTSGTSNSIVVLDPYASLVVSVKDANGDHATYIVDYAMRS